MTTPFDAAPEMPANSQSAPTMTPVRPMYWSLRRELWENRSLYLAPLIVAAVFMFGFVISTIGMPHRRRATMMLDPAHQRAVIERPFDTAAIMLMATAFIIGIFYCLDALYGERRDRSILFWTSLPVSDRTVVLSKACVPLAVLPLLTFAVTVTVQLAMLMWTTLILLPSGLAGTTFQHFNPFENSLVLLYGLITVALWHAPVYGWLLMVSAWAKRATFLWAVLPPLVIAAFETIAFHTSYIGHFLRYRFIGGFGLAFAMQAPGVAVQPPQLTPGTFLTAPGLWFGLLFAAAFLAATVRLRRYREPI
jgi:ABC-2 type transport system permease protein